MMKGTPVRSRGVTDALTVARRQRPRERLELLYRCGRDDVYAYVAAMLGDRASAEEVTALALERAFRRRMLFDARRGSERAWLFGIARNAALDELRRRRRSRALLHDAPEEHSAVQDEVDQILQRAALRSALQTLSHRERELIALKFHASLLDSLRRSLGDARADRASLLGQIARAEPEKLGALHARLGEVEARISSLQAQLSSVSSQIANTSISLTVSDQAPASPGSSGDLTPGGAVHVAGEILSTALAVLLIALAATLPIALALALGWSAIAAARRRQRERALDTGS
jgi:RNA polymerase sigma factor (sigma-70 family)